MDTNKNAVPAYSALQMQDVRRRLLRAEEQRDAATAMLASQCGTLAAKAAALDALVEEVEAAGFAEWVAGGGFVGEERWSALGAALKAAKLAQVSK